jgi:hypothetical protein
MAKKKFNYLEAQTFEQDEQGRYYIHSSAQREQFKARAEAETKIKQTNELKQQIQDETNNLLAQYAKEKQGFERKAMIGKAAQFVVDPRMWAKGVWEVGKMVTENARDVFIGAPRGAMQSKEATKLYEQSAALNNEATRLVQTDKTKSEELLRQSQELYKTAQEKYGKAVGNLGELTTGKQIAAKSALAALDIGSFLLPGGPQIKVQTAITTKVATKVPVAVQTTKLTGRANLISNALGLGDIYQGAQVAIKQGLGEATEQTLRGQAIRAAYQGPVYGTLGVLADEEQDDTLGNIVKSSFITGITASGLTLGFGWAGRALVSKVAPKAGTMPTPTPAKPQLLLPDPTRVYKGQVITPPDTRILPPDIDPASLSLDEIKKRSLGLGVGEKLTPTQDPIKQSLGAFDPETTIPMLDLTKTVKGNNIDFNPDSALSVNSARKVVDDLALLNGKQVGGKSLQIDKNDPKYQEIYNTQIKPLIDKINAVDEVVDVQIKKSYEVQFNEKEQVLIYRGEKYDTYNELAKVQTKRYNEIIKKRNPEDLEELNDAYFKFKKDLNNKQNLTPEQIAFVKKIDKEIYEGNTSSDLISKEVGKKIETSEDLEKLSKKLGKEKVQELADRFRKEASDKIENAWQKFYKKNYKTSVEPQPQFNKIPAEEVELEVSKIYNTLENEGFKIVPEKVVDTPAIDALDEKLAKGDQPTVEEMDASMKELVDTTGDPEVIAGVQQELNDRVKKSRFFERVKSANPEAIDPNASVFYEASRRAEDEKFADDLVINDFDKALEIASDINTKANPTGRDNLVVQKTIKKLIELGRNDEVNNITGNLSYKLTKSGDFIAATANSTIADPVSVILKQTQIRQSKFSKEIQTEVAKVKEQLNNVVIDKDAIIEILDNITCR